MARFLPLMVSDIRKETREAVVVTLKPRDEDRANFAFIQGQYLTFRRLLAGEELRRSYSICSGLDDGVLRIGIKRVDGGIFSTWANEELRAGDVLEAMPPMGAFHTSLDASRSRHYLAFAGGSGITPVLGLLRTTLSREPKSRFTLIYANRSANTIMFREELEDLKNEHLGRFSMMHVLESEAQDIELFTGRIDKDKCARLFKHWIDISKVDFAFICGPEQMMLTIAAALREHGVGDDRIKFELFASPHQGSGMRRVDAAQADTKAGDCEAIVTLDGTTRAFKMPKQGQSLLEAALANSIDAPFACKAGVCSTCRAMIIEGQAEMQANHALEDYEVRRGYVLTCQCYPLSDRIVVSYDQ